MFNTGNVKKALTERTTKNDDRNGVIERARREREERKIARESAKYALTIQRYWRGRHFARLWFIDLRKDADKKLGDIKNLSMILKTTKSIEFVPPIQISAYICRAFTFCPYHAAKDVGRLLILCEFVLLKSLVEVESGKNVAMILSNSEPLVLKLCKILMESLDPKVLKGGRFSSTDARQILAPCILFILGAGEPFRIRYCEALQSAFLKIRSMLTKNSDQFNILKAIRNIYYIRVRDTHLDSLQDDSSTLNPVKISSTYSENDVLWEACLFLIESDVSLTEYRLSEFARDIFTSPCVLVLLTSISITRLTTWKYFSKLLTYWNTPHLALPPSPHSVFHSGQWLLGNVAAMAPYLPLLLTTTATSATTSNNNNDAAPISHTYFLRDDSTSNVLLSAQLKLYLDICRNLLETFPIPGVLLGRGGILWSRNGNQLTASAVPRALSFQLFCLLDSSVMSQLVVRILLPLRTQVDHLSSLGSKEDRSDVEEALKVSGESMAQEAVKPESLANGNWFGAKWARKLLNSVSSSFSNVTLSDYLQPSLTTTYSTSTSTTSSKNNHQLQGSSSTPPHPPQPQSGSEHPLDLSLVNSLCSLWNAILPSAAAAAVDSHPWRALSSLSFSPQSIELLWIARLALGGPEASRVGFQNPTGKDIKQLRGSREKTNEKDKDSNAALGCLCSCLKLCLIVLDDSELYEQERPLPLPQLLPLIRTLKMILYESLRDNPMVLAADPAADPTACSPDPLMANDRSVAQLQYAKNQKVLMLRAYAAVLSNLHSRWARRPFSSRTLWEVEDTESRQIRNELRSKSPFANALLHYMPWSLALRQRLELFREVISAERIAVQGDSQDPTAARSRGTVIRVRRGRSLLQDGMAALAKVSASSLKDRLVIRYIDETGQEEAGIDAGGLFKDFWTDLAAAAFDPSLGLFALTPDQLLFPSPSSTALFGLETESLFHFLGRILGKAMFEDLTVQPRFAHFFLAFMPGKYSFLNLLQDLASLDSELHKNLLFLKSYEGDIADLCLTFSVTDDTLGVQKEIELMPGGSRMTVTSANRHRYISAVAKYYLHDRLKSQATSFFRGLYEVVSPELLSMFCAPELQVLLSGSCTGIGVDELRKHVRYAAGYSSLDPNVNRFWTVMSQLSEADKAAVIRFVTACERPPCLGWGALQPPFTIQRIDCSDDSRLPSASTCFNTLKLPVYSSSRILRDKLLTAVREAGGFHLS